MSIRLIFFVLVSSIFYGSVFAEVTWLNDLEAAKQSSKLMKKPILLWVGKNTHRTRPMIVTEKKFDDLSKKILCVNLNPMELTDEQRQLYDIDNSDFSRFYYYDIDFRLLGFEDNPPKSIITYVNNMIQSVEAKVEAKKDEKKEAEAEEGAKALWEKANRFEVEEKYDPQLQTLKQLVAKFPNSSFAELAKLKIDKLETDPTMLKVIEVQKKEDAAVRAVRAAETMLRNNKADAAKKKLESVISTYPGTKAAERAKELLKDL